MPSASTHHAEELGISWESGPVVCASGRPQADTVPAPAVAT
ncbi:hypothetical protein [Brevibacterium album]|nr:hypothetical protein [Brevibacterium album]